jgi:glyoxylase-like metal-dependent hydrolase (beta-lactamase superfamily II)
MGLSRRGFCLCCVSAGAFAATGSWLSPRQAFAQARNAVDVFREQAGRAPINVHRLRGGVIVLEGSGGNVAAFAGPDGKVLVDAGLTASKPRILDALSVLGNQPIRLLINTHWHFDHADGNEWLNAEGATILAHDNTRKHLLATQRVEDWDFDFPPAPRGAVPTEVFADRRSVAINGATLDLAHYEPAHTDSDISVRFEPFDILHTGDTYWNGFYPFIDYSTGGSIDGAIAAASANVDKATKETIVIPGHGFPASDRAGLVAFRDMLTAVRTLVSRLKEQGRSLEETVAARPTRAFDETWGRFAVTPAVFTKLVYEGV